MNVTAHSDRGDRPYQEDAYLVPAASTDSPVVAVFDGMGGAAGGAVASDLAREELSASWEASALPGLCDRLEAAAHAANARVYERQRADRSLAGMGTTLVAAAWRVHAELGLLVAVVSVGDSRAYLVRGGKIHQVTRDHTVVAESVENGWIKPENAARHPRRHVLTRAVGTTARVPLDGFRFTVKPGDALVLCSDGLYGELEDDAILGLVGDGADAKALVVAALRAAEERREAAEAGDGERGEAADNCTAVVVRL